MIRMFHSSTLDVCDIVITWFISAAYDHTIQCDLKILICVRAAADLKRAGHLSGMNLTVFNHTDHYFCYKHSNHRSTVIKVYSSDISSDVYGSD